MKTFNLIVSRGIGTLLVLMLSFAVFAQLNPVSDWVLNPYDKKVFIENKGQFDGQDLLPASEIKYGADNAGVKIFFSPTGLTYRFEQLSFNPEGEEKEKESIEQVDVYTLNLQWLNSNPGVEIIAEEPVSEYFNYADKDDPVHKSILHARAFEKLIYRNLYSGIDVEYQFHPETGIKYTLIVHPGGNLAQVSMKYTGDESLFRLKKGNLQITTPAGIITDHAPVSWINRNGKKVPVASSFVLSKDAVKFKTGKYDHSQTLIIDPWTIIPVELGADLRVYNIQKDNAGSVYIYGGASPSKIQKYDAAGLPLWTYSTGYSCGIACGNMIADTAGNVYLTSIGNITKLNKAGTVVWQVTPGFCELWTLSLNCNYTRLAIGTGCGSGSIFYLNCSNGATASPLVNISGGEIRALTTAPNGNLYALSFLVSDLVALDPALNTLYTIPSAHVFDYLGPNYTPWSQQNAIAADLSSVYTSDGTVIHKRNRVTGVLEASVVIPGGVLESNSGIAVDSCGNVYAGSQNFVYKFDANLLPSGLPAAVSGPVYDVKIGTGGEVLACGAGFVASLGGLNACVENILSCCPAITLNFVSTNTNCNGNNGSATVNALGGALPYTYLWNTSPPQTTQTAINLAAGIYTCTVTDAGKCQKTGTVTIGNATGLKDSIINQTDVLCHGGSDGSATAAASGGVPGYTYLWNTVPAQAAATATGLQAGMYICTVTDNTGCTATTNVTIKEPFKMSATIFLHKDVSCNGGNDGNAQLSIGGGTAPYAVSWNTAPVQNTGIATNLSAGTYVVTVTDKNNCTTTDTVTVTEPPALNLSETHADVLCNGDLNGAAAVEATGGTPPYSYAWNTNPVQTGKTATGLGAGNYSVLITDSNGCEKSLTVSIKEPEVLTVTTTSTDASCYGKTDGTATISAVSGGTPPYTYLWSSSPSQSASTATGLPAGIYTVTITDKNNCTTTDTVTITEPPVFSAILSARYSVCPLITDTFTVQVSGGIPPYTYVWTPDIGSGTGPLTAESKEGASYFVTVTDAQLCSAVSNTITPDHNCYFFNIPDAFTPNGDGINDVFMPDGEGIHMYNFRIYNRWGEEIFHTNKLNVGWDGTIKDHAETKAPAGTYIYIIKANDQHENLRTYTGTVFLNE